MIKTPLSTMIGGAFWTPGATILGSSSKTLTQIIKSIFSVGGQGFAYDPNDLTTLYQDAAGTIPVTAAGQPVGLMLDKSKGLVLGINITIMSQWGGYLGFTYTAPNLSISNTSGVTQYPQRPILAVGKWYKVQVTCSSAVGNIKFSNQGGSTQSPVLTVGTITAYILAADANLVWSLPNNSSATITAFTVQELTGNHAYQTVSASRPSLQRNATTGAYYLAFDGVDDFLQTNSIDFTATDKVSLFAGVRKLSDAGRGMIVELSSSVSNAGAFSLEGSTNGVDSYASQSNGINRSITGVTNDSLKAPSNAVLTMKSDIASDYLYLKANQYSNVSGLDQGTGNFGNYPLYIGRRAGLSLPFSGHLYNLIGISRLTTDSETIALEKAIAKNTGVTLNV